ncbi:MAG: hypothetical protein FJY10_06730 [Bacteroidetes bacterium]|nr:hypothetical protein [Bacteroidota bacterium]
MKRGIMIMWLISALAAAGQDFRYYDSLTYHQYQNKDWQGLIDSSRNAVNKNIDYFYLRLRRGIAYYELGKFVPASRQLERAAHFDASDPVTLNYLYHAYLNSNKRDYAQAEKAKMPPHLRDQYKRPYEWLNGVYLTGGLGFSNSYQKNEDNDLLGKDSLYGEQDLYGDRYAVHFGMDFRITPAIKIYAGYSNPGFSKRKQITYITEEKADSNQMTWGVEYIYRDSVHNRLFDYRINQHEIYLNASLIWHRIKITPAFHHLHLKHHIITAKADTIWYYRQPDYDTLQSVRTVYTIDVADTAYNNWLISLALEKNFNWFDLMVSGSYSELNAGNQTQLGIQSTWYPTGNLNWYGTTGITAFFSKSANRILLSQSVGMKVMQKVWMEGYFRYGNISNMNFQYGSIVYNTPEKSLYDLGVTLIWVPIRRLSVTFQYQNIRYRNSYLVYHFKQNNPANEAIPRDYNNKYNIQSITGGLSWNF